MNYDNSLRVVRGISILVLLIGLAIFAGWWFHLPWLLDPTGRHSAPVFTAGICLSLSAGMLCASATRRYATETALAALVLLVASGTIYAYAFGTTFILDRLFVDPWQTRETRFPGRLAPDSAMTFVLLAVAHLRRNVAVRFRASFVQICAACAMVLPGLALVGYITGWDSIGVWTNAPVRMSLINAAGLFLLALGLWIRETSNGRAFAKGVIT